MKTLRERLIEAIGNLKENSEDELYYWLTDIEDIMHTLFQFSDKEEFLSKFKELYPDLLYWIRAIYKNFYGEDEIYHNSNKPFEALSKDMINDLYFACLELNRKLSDKPKLLSKKVNEAMKTLAR